MPVWRSTFPKHSLKKLHVIEKPCRYRFRKQVKINITMDDNITIFEIFLILPLNLRLILVIGSSDFMELSSADRSESPGPRLGIVNRDWSDSDNS